MPVAPEQIACPPMPMYPKAVTYAVKSELLCYLVAPWVLHRVEVEV